MLEVRSSTGDLRLGGLDWDRAIVNYLLKNLRADHGVDLSQDVIARARLGEAAEQAKIDLSQAGTTTISVPMLGGASGGGAIDLNARLTRSAFQAQTIDLVDRARVLLREAIGNADSVVDHVLLIGAAARMPAISDMVRAETGIEPRHGGDDLVARGAAVQAGILKGEINDLVLLDAIPHAVGIEVGDGERHTMIERNTTTPTKRTETVIVEDNGSAAVVVGIFEGEGSDGGDRFIGGLSLRDLPPAPDGHRRVEVTVNVDANATVQVTAKDEASGVSESVWLPSEVVLSREDLDRMVRDVEAETTRLRAGLPHVAADVDTTQQRTRPTEVELQATLGAIHALLPALDVCEMAVQNGDHHLAETHAELMATLERLGVRRIASTGVAFDPHEHEAMRHDEPDSLPGGPMVCRVLRPGYAWHDRLVRPAWVEAKG